MLVFKEADADGSGSITFKEHRLTLPFASRYKVFIITCCVYKGNEGCLG